MAFGAPASGGGLFGSPFGTTTATPAFGQAAPASPFGATTPGFGATAQSQPAFSFSQSTPAAGTSLFGGGAQASPSPFGTTTTPAPFGSTPSPGLFGANSSPSVFGAASAPSLFGGTSTPAFGAASTTPSWFGASAPATTSAFGGSFFGTPGASTPASTSLFAPASGTAQTSTSIWGTPQPAASPSPFGNMFGPGAPTAAVIPQPVDSALKEIQEIKAAYTPGNPQYRFQYLLLNVVDNPAARVKPPTIDEMRWRQALAAAGGPENADRLWPVPAHGFKDLLARSAAQVAAVDENASRLKALQDLAFRLAKRQGSELKQRASAIQRQHQELAARLLHTVRLLDALEARLAAYTGYRSDIARAKEDKLSRQLTVVEAELAPGAVTGLTRRLNSVASAAQMAASNPGTGGNPLAKMDGRSSAALLSVLRDHADGVSKLQALLKRDLQDMAIMKHELGSDEPGGGQRIMVMD